MPSPSLWIRGLAEKLRVRAKLISAWCCGGCGEVGGGISGGTCDGVWVVVQVVVVVVVIQLVDWCSVLGIDLRLALDWEWMWGRWDGKEHPLDIN